MIRSENEWLVWKLSCRRADASRESKDSFWFILVLAGQTVTAVHIDYRVSAYIEGETF